MNLWIYTWDWSYEILDTDKKYNGNDKGNEHNHNRDPNEVFLRLVMIKIMSSS